MLSVLVDQVLRRCCLYVVLSQLEKARSFLGVYRIGEVSQVKNLLCAFAICVFPKIPAPLTVGLIFMKRISLV